MFQEITQIEQAFSLKSVSLLKQKWYCGDVTQAIGSTVSRNLSLFD